MHEKIKPTGNKHFTRNEKVSDIIATNIIGNNTFIKKGRNGKKIKLRTITKRTRNITRFAIILTIKTEAASPPISRIIHEAINIAI